MKESLQKLNHKRKVAREHIAPRLMIRLKIFAFIIAIIIGVVIYKIVLGDITIVRALFGLLLGTLLGFLAGRMFKIFWHDETQKVVSRLDKIGVIFLILYIAIEILKSWFFRYWFEGAELSAFSLIFVAGLLLGRLLAMTKNIKKVLVEEDKIS